MLSLSASAFAVLAAALLHPAMPVDATTVALVAAGTTGAAVAGLAALRLVRLRRLLEIRSAELADKHAALERESEERRQTMNALARSEERLRLALEAAQMLTWDWDAVADQGVAVGPAASRLGNLSGGSQDTLEGFIETVHPEDRDRVWDALASTIDRGTAFDPTFRVVMSDGSVRWFAARGRAFTDANGTVMRLIGVTQDVTEQKRAEAELRASEERFRELFENANDIVYTHDLAGNFTSVNKAATELIGYARDEVLRMNIAQLLVPEQLEQAREMTRQKMAGGPPTSYELAILRKDGSPIAIEVNTRLIRRDGEVVGVQGIGRDITERKRLEAQLRQSQKMESVGTLAGGVAHDFNNLLTAISGNVELSRSLLPADHELQEPLAEIEQAAGRAAALTRQLLLFSRRQQPERRAVALGGVVTEFLRMLRRIIGEDVELELRIEPDLPPVSADAGQLEQVVMNLAVNARDAMPDGGRLSIELSAVTFDDAFCREHAWARGGRWVRLRVADGGVGMTPETLQRMFEPFFTTKQLGHGTGLGLAVVYGIVQQHDGLIDVTSARGQGTTVDVYFPTASAPVAVAAERPRRSTPLGQGTVLVAEDEPALCKLADRILASLGYRVLVASDGEEALRLFGERSAEIDVVMLDVVMPKKGGREVYEAIRASGSGVPVFFVSGYNSELAPGGIAARTGCRLVQKPYSVEELASAVHEAVAGAAA